MNLEQFGGPVNQEKADMKREARYIPEVEVCTNYNQHLGNKNDS